MSTFEQLCQDVVELCKPTRQLPHIVLQPCIDEAGGSVRPGYTATIIVYRYPNTGTGTLTLGRRQYTGEWYVLRGKTEPLDGDAEDEQYVSGTGSDPCLALEAAIGKVREKQQRGEWPRRQLRLPNMDTVAELLAYDTTRLRDTDLAWVRELDGVPPQDPLRARTHWGGTLVFLRKLAVAHQPDGDTIFEAPSGGFWVRVRDVA